MKKQVFFLISALLCIVLYVQSYAQNSSPAFKGDKNVNAIRSADNATLINNYLLDNIICPKSAAECCKEGTEIVQFTVTKSGDLKDFKVINSVCHELDDEVIRVLKTTNGDWEPGVEDGVPVAKKQEVTFMFGDHDRSAIVSYFVKLASRHYSQGSKNLIFKHNPKKALWHFNKGINYMPNDKALLALRGLCHYELGKTANAKKDWERIMHLGGVAQGVKFDELTELKGHEEMTRILAQYEKN